MPRRHCAGRGVMSDKPREAPAEALCARKPPQRVAMSGRLALLIVIHLGEFRIDDGLVV